MSEDVWSHSRWNKKASGDLIYLVIIDVIDWTCILRIFCSAPSTRHFFETFDSSTNLLINASLNHVFCFYCEALRRIFVFKLVNLFKIKSLSGHICCWKFEKAFSTHKKLKILAGFKRTFEMRENRTSRRIWLEINHKNSELTNF